MSLKSIKPIFFPTLFLHKAHGVAEIFSCVMLLSLLVAHWSGAVAAPLGGGLTGVVDWVADNPFANWAKQSRGVFVYGSNGQIPVSVGADGLPTGDFWLRVYDQDLPAPAGDYTITYQGPADSAVDQGVSGGVLTDRGYANGQRTFTLHLDSVATTVVEFNFTNTHGMVKNIQVIPPGFSTGNPPLFADAYLNLLKNLNPVCLRFMDWHATNGNMESRWLERSLPTDPTFNSLLSKSVLVEGSANGLGHYQTQTFTKGVPWEYAVQLANALGKDMWVNIPLLADNDYVTNLAKLIKNGSTVGGVFYPGLKAGLNVYLEYSNEVWNDGFLQTGVNRQLAVNQVVNGWKSSGNLAASNLNYDNLPLDKGGSGSYVFYQNYVVWGDRRVARRIKEISDLFANVWGKTAINKVIRPVLAYQLSSYRFDNQLSYLNAVYGQPNQYLYGVAVAPYLNAGNGQGLDARTDLSSQDVLNALQAATDSLRTTNTLPSIAAQATYYGLKMLAYEGGPDTFGENNIAAKKSATLSPDMSPLVQDYLTLWFQNGGDLFNWFVTGVDSFSSKYGTWAITNNINDYNQPKELGFKAIRNKPAPGESIGRLVPAVLDARATVDAPKPFAASFYQRFIGAGSKFDYLVRAATAGGYSLQVNLGNGNGSPQPLLVYLNNNLLQQVTAPATVDGQFADTPPINLSLKQGLNVIRLVVPTERPYELNSLKVSRTTSTTDLANLPKSNFYSFYESIPAGQSYEQTFKVEDDTTPASQIKVSVVTDNPILMPQAGINLQTGHFDGGANNRKLTLRPTSGKIGTVNLNLTVSNANQVSRSLAIKNFAVTSSDANPPDFTVDLEEVPGVAAKIGGKSSWVPFYLRPQNGLKSAVSMTAARLPKGVTVAFRPSAVTDAQELQFTVASTVKPGNYNVSLVGSAGNLSHSVPLRLTVH